MNAKSYILVPSLCKWVTSSLPPVLLLFLSGWLKKRGRPHHGEEMLFWVASPAGAYIDPRWATMDLSAIRGKPFFMNNTGFFSDHHVVSGVNVCTCTSRCVPKLIWFFFFLKGCKICSADALHIVTEEKEFSELVVTNEGLMTLGLKLPDEWRLTLWRTFSGKLKPSEDRHTRQSLLQQGLLSVNDFSEHL